MTSTETTEPDNDAADAAAEFVTVADAAAQLGTNLPRLQRLLKRPEFAAHAIKQERSTRTGTRTVTTVNVSVLPLLRVALDEGITEQKHEHKRPKVLALGDEQTRVYLQFMMDQADARIREQAATIEDLRRDKDEWRTERERLQGQVLTLASEVQSLRLLAEAAAPADDVSQEATEAPQSLDVELGGITASPAADMAQEQRRGFWIRWPWQRRQG